MGPTGRVPEALSTHSTESQPFNASPCNRKGQPPTRTRGAKSASQKPWQVQRKDTQKTQMRDRQQGRNVTQTVIHFLRHRKDEQL